MFEHVANAKSSKLRIVVPVLLAVGVIALVSHEIHSKRVQALKIAEETAAGERNWLKATHDQIGELGMAVDGTDARIAAVRDENSKPVRKGGPLVSPEHWSEEGVASFRIAHDNRVSVVNQLNDLMKQYNKRRAAYTGPWPGNVRLPESMKGRQ